MALFVATLGFLDHKINSETPPKPTPQVSPTILRPTATIFRVEPPTLVENDELDENLVLEIKPTLEAKKKLITPTSELSAIVTHDGTRTGQIIKHKDWCTFNEISLYENELIPNLATDGNTYYGTVDDWKCYRNRQATLTNYGTYQYMGPSLTTAPRTTAIYDYTYQTPTSYLYKVPTPTPTKSIMIYGGSGGTTYRQIGSTVYGSDGTTLRRIGSTYYDNEGTSYREIGSTTYGSDGTTQRQIGKTIYTDSGTTYRQIGSTVYGSDGTSCRKIGSTTYCN